MFETAGGTLGAISSPARKRATEMTTIRPAARSDVAAITAIYNDAIRNTTATFDTEPRTIDDRLRWFESHGPRHPVLVVEEAGEVVGWACLSPWSVRPAYNETAETSFYVAESHRGRGFGRRLKEAIIEEARRIGFHTLIAGVAQGSDASRHLNEQFGFVSVGVLKEVGHKFGKRLDVEILQKMLD